jgi:hypothetical protein
MTQLTIRGVDGNLQQILKHEAERRGQSVNRYVLSLLQEAAGVLKEGSRVPPEFRDLDHLAGTWTQQDFEEFEEQLALQRSIDEELWR